MNEAGEEDGVPELAAVTDLPILQDDEIAQVWTGWGATWRDVYVLDPHNEVVAVYNLSENSLADPANYEELKAIFVAAWTD